MPGYRHNRMREGRPRLLQGRINGFLQPGVPQSPSANNPQHSGAVFTSNVRPQAALIPDSHDCTVLVDLEADLGATLVTPEEGPLEAEPAGLWGHIRPVLGRAVRGVGHFIDRQLHPWRRQSARTLIHRKGATGFECVLVLCLGNICRSPYAAQILKRRFESSGIAAIVEQGGFIGPNRAPTRSGIEVAAQGGMDLRAHRSRLITTEGLRQASIVIVMEPRQARMVERHGGRRGFPTIILGDLDPFTPATRAILDPFGRGEEFYQHTYERIERCVAEFVRIVHRQRTERRQVLAGQPHGSKDSSNRRPSI